MVIVDDPDRFRTMNLMSDGPCTIPNEISEKKKALKLDRGTNNISDIEGTKPSNYWTKYTKKPDLWNNEDIHGVKSKVLHKKLRNKPDNQLFNDDIEGSKPRPKLFRTTRHVDPLVPEYKLPSYKVMEPEIPKFIRDNISNDDIKGSKPTKLYKWQMRDGYSPDDVEGAQAHWRPRHERARREAAPHDIMKVNDISKKQSKSTRVTNPLRPEYFINGLLVADDLVKTQPRKLPKRKDCPFFSLVTDDIAGAQPGWKPPEQLFPPIEQRRHFRNTNFIGDIPGAQADTVNYAIRTDRVVNPLNPTYVSLDGEPLKAPMTPLYKDPATFEAEMQLELAQARAERARKKEEYLKQKNNVPESGSAPGTATKNEEVEKDNLILKLSKEVEKLKTEVKDLEVQVPPLQNEATLMPAMKKSDSMPLIAATTPIEKSMMKSESSVNLKSSTPISNNDEFVPPRSALTSSNSNKGLFLKEEVPDRKGSYTSERMVLTSSNGKPRIQMTPSEQRAAKELAEDIESVRSLKM